MDSNDFFILYNYYQILNKAIIRNKIFHFLFCLLDTMITLIKILYIYKTHYHTIPDNSLRYIKIISFFEDYSTNIKLLPLIIYLAIGYAIPIIYCFFNNTKKYNKLDMIIINFFEFILLRLLISFYFDFLFNLSPLYLLLFLLLTIPFMAFIFMDMTFFHLTGFMLQIIVFPFDDFTSLCDRQKIIIKIIISISLVSKNLFICKFMMILQFTFHGFYLIYNSYIMFYKSYYIMNNELICKTKYSNLFSLFVIQIFMFIMDREEVFKKFFIVIFVFIIIFTSIFTFLFYNPYNYIVIDIPKNRENAFYYLFLVDRNKDVTYFLEEKIKDHINKCNSCSLCSKYQVLINNNIIKYEDKFETYEETDLFQLLYDGKDKSILLYNHITQNIKKLGNNCLYNNSYYIINLIYIFYSSSKIGDISLSLNQLLLFELIQENNKALIVNHKISIKQIVYANEFLILYKNILTKIREIITKTNFKKYFNKFFELSEKLTALNSSKFKDSLYGTKNEGVSNCSYIITMCSLLYEEIFNTTLSSYAVPIRENAQLHEDIIKQFFRQNNNITLDFNLKTLECKIINAGKELFYYINTNFYDLFPIQIKEVLIQTFSEILLNSKEKNNLNNSNKNSKQTKRIHIEPILLIKIDNDNIKYYRTLNLKLALLLNDFMDKNILLSGYFYINEHILVTINNKGKKEKIMGFGNKEIMDTAFKCKLHFNSFKNSHFMKNKILNYHYSISMNNTNLSIYNISEIKKKKKKLDKREISKKITSNDTFTLKKGSSLNEKNDKFTSNFAGSEMNYKEQIEEENSNTNSNENNEIQNINNLLEETASQSSAATKTSGNSFWNLNKELSRQDQNNFSSKKFLNLQLLLGGLLLTLLILMIVLIIELRLLQVTLSQYCNNYFDLHQFVRVFQQFSYGFLTIACIVKDIKENIGDCQPYLSVLDKESFNRTLFITEQNAILAEICSESISKIILNSETIHDEKLISLFKGNISYNVVSIKRLEGSYNISHSLIDTSFNDALYLLSNNMRIIISPESKLKNRNKEPIYLISGLENPFLNIKDKNEEISDFQIAIYTYLINYKLFVQRFTDLNSRLSELINIKNDQIINILNIFHNIIFVVMLFQILTILIYLITYNKILAQIINSIIIKFDEIFDDENDFKKLFTTKINELESILNIYPSNPINFMNEINKNYLKYKNLINKKKKNEQKFNASKKVVEEEDETTLFKDKQKYINWTEIYQKGYNRFYIIFTIIIAITDITVYGIILGIWMDYQFKSEATLELIYLSWNFERNTLRVVNFYNTMIFNNQTLDDITNDYFSDGSNTVIENIHRILYSYYELRKKRKSIPDIYNSFTNYAEYNCNSLYDVMESIKLSSFSQTLDIMREKYNLNINELKKEFARECNDSQPFIGNSVSPAFQNLYQKLTDSMILFNDRSYEGIIKKVFNSSFPKLSAVFLNVTRYIIYIVGKVTYMDASNKIIEILGKCIVITLILYILSEISLFIFFVFVYIWNMNTEYKNMFRLKSVFEITNSIES